MMNYKNIMIENNIRAPGQLYNLFWDQVSSLWTNEYVEAFPKHGEITLQNFQGYSFLIDHIWPDVQQEDINNELPETRVIGFFGISNTNIDANNRKRMKAGWGKTSIAFSEFGASYDKGHFIAHGFGGPVDVNIFPQRRDVNRGWSEEGKRFRKMERFVAANPGTLVFSRPIYNDLTICPHHLEYGYFDEELNLFVKDFTNR
jgi:hypothetical protein